MKPGCPLVSAIIPTFNRAHIISRSIDSVKNQTYDNWELIILDDGSTDGTKDFITQKYLDDGRIRFFKRPETRAKGANACRNIGVEKANGSYVAFLDSDDEWLPEHLESKMDKIQSTGAEFVFGSYRAITMNRSTKIECNSKENESVDFYLTDHGDIGAPTFVVKRSSFLQVKFDEKLEKHQDWDFGLRFCKKYSYAVDECCTVNIYNTQKVSMSNSPNHHATEQFLVRHKEDLRGEAIENILKIMGVNTFNEEKRSAHFLKYAKLLRENGTISSKRSFIIAYIYPIPLLGSIVHISLLFYRKLKYD